MKIITKEEINCLERSYLFYVQVWEEKKKEHEYNVNMLKIFKDTLSNKAYQLVKNETKNIRVTSENAISKAFKAKISAHQELENLKSIKRLQDNQVENTMLANIKNKLTKDEMIYIKQNYYKF